MINMTNEMTTWTNQCPSGFAMPTCGHANGSTLGSNDRGTSATAFARKANVSGSLTAADESVIKGDMGLAVAYVVPGTNAWSPPLC
ncbi:MAG: hypothetical protein WKF79_01210 [Nocardioides sp.]